MRKYPSIKAGQWLSPVRKGYKMACCDCGLVHKMDFALIPWRNGGKKIILRAFRDNRATAAIRRYRKHDQ